MRFLCEFETKDLPVSYRMIFVSMIKDVLKREDGSLYEELFTYGDGKKNKATKSYTFAVLLRNPKIDGERIRFEGNVRWFFSSPDPKILINVYNGLKRLNTFSYREEKLDLKKITLLPQKVIGDEIVVFKTLSPIHIKDKFRKTFK
ncbi:CRISPR-associated endoribonuclease Cas6, partial [Thermotoga sp.]|uniref:CRISPR-associated endoribonuclease Cas6 n=1 Tax=Thermotoga sp. TaxID=28240 RepID=UPI0025E17DBC